jgi:single-strand DNA-binding protein
MIIGRLGADPELRSMPSGDQVANFSVATGEKWKDKETGEQHERTEWHRISVFGGLAKVCGQYLKKGSQVYIDGQIRTRKWTDKAGVERYSTEIICQNMQMLGSKPENAGASTGAKPSSSTPRAAAYNRQANTGTGAGTGSDKNYDDGDDIPF